MRLHRGSNNVRLSLQRSCLVQLPKVEILVRSVLMRSQNRCMRYYGDHINNGVKARVHQPLFETIRLHWFISPAFRAVGSTHRENAARSCRFVSSMSMLARPTQRDRLRSPGVWIPPGLHTRLHKLLLAKFIRWTTSSTRPRTPSTADIA